MNFIFKSSSPLYPQIHQTEAKQKLLSPFNMFYHLAFVTLNMAIFLSEKLKFLFPGSWLISLSFACLWFFCLFVCLDSF